MVTIQLVSCGDFAVRSPVCDSSPAASAGGLWYAAYAISFFGCRMLRRLPQW
jgi:hypothetical protein